MSELFDLQLFAELPGVEDDNPSAADEEESFEELFGEGEEGQEEEAATETASEEKQEETPPAQAETQPEQPPQRLFTQADVDRIVQERLARDRKIRQLRELEQLAGMDLEGILAHVKENQVKAIAEEKGISEEDARHIVENQERLRRLEEEMQAERAYREHLARTMAYQQAKMRYMNNPLVKKYEAEIDAFSQHGLLVDFEPAMNYIIGQHALMGDLLKDVKATTQQQVLAEIAKRGKVAPEAQANAAPQAISLTPEQKRYARALGVSEKEYAEELAKHQRELRGLRR